MKNRVQTKKVLSQKCGRGVYRLTLFAVAGTKGSVRCE